MTCATQRLDHCTLLIGEGVWQLEADVCWVVYILGQGTMHRRHCKESDVWVKVVPPLPVSVLYWAQLTSLRMSVVPAITYPKATIQKLRPFIIMPV